MNSFQAAPGSQASLREANRLRVLDALRDQGAMTQVEIAGFTGLSPATVSNMVKELDTAGAVQLEPSIRNGRRAVLVSLATGNTLIAGIAFGDRDVRVALGTGPAISRSMRATPSVTMMRVRSEPRRTRKLVTKPSSVAAKPDSSRHAFWGRSPSQITNWWGFKSRTM